MIDYQQYFKWPQEHIEYFYVYFFLACIAAGYLVYKLRVKYKVELFFISFYLLTGNLNKILTIELPGISLFEIKPIRLIFLLLCFFMLRRTLFHGQRLNVGFKHKIPWFIVALLAYVSWSILSVLMNSDHMEFTDVMVSIHDGLAFLAIMYGLSLMRDKPSYELLRISIIVAAVISTVVSLVQFSVDPYFLRIGDDRVAFASVIRSNGLFSSEYFNSYFLIMAISWILITVKRDTQKIILVAFLALGVLTSFQRMSWVILAVVLFTYLVFIRKLAFGKLMFYGLSGFVIVLSISIFYYQDIMRSSLVQERLADSIGGRAGYYELVLDNIGKKPVFGFGDLKNETYYQKILQITSSRERASAESGDLHSGYFSALYLHGVPGFVGFLLFVLLSVLYYAKQSQKDLFFVIPFLVSIIYLISNLTNTFLFLKYTSILFAIHIGIAMGVRSLREQETLMELDDPNTAQNSHK